MCKFEVGKFYSFSSRCFLVLEILENTKTFAKMRVMCNDSSGSIQVVWAAYRLYKEFK